MIEQSAHDAFRQDVPCIIDGCAELTSPDRSECPECRTGNSPAHRAVAYRKLGDIPLPGQREKPSTQRPRRTRRVVEDLTAREIAVLAAIADGDEVGDIAARLCLSKWTVISHRKHALRKLGARTSPHGIAIAFQRGILSIDR